MKTSFAMMVGVIAFLGGCNLEEAQRMDLSRAEVLGVDSKLDGAMFRGARDISLSTLMQMLGTAAFDSGWALQWEDRGTSPEPRRWQVEAWLNDTLLFTVDHLWDINCVTYATPNATWMDRAEDVMFSLRFEGAGEPWETIQIPAGIRILDDRPRLEWDASQEAVRTFHKGDTVTLSFRNPNADSIEVYSDYTGLRSVDEYVLKLAPQASGKFRWVVTAKPGSQLWIDLGWGMWGASHRFELVVE